MATWRKALVLGLAVVVGAVPVLARVDLGLQAAAPVVQQPSVPLPQGDEMGDDELLQAEGEFWWFIIAVLAGAAGAAAGGTIYEKWFDEDPGVIDRDDRRAIVGYTIWGAVAGATGGIGARFTPK